MTTCQDSAAAIHTYWTSFWQRLRQSIPSFAERKQALLAGVQRPPRRLDVPFPTGEELLKMRQTSKGAAGPDGWTGQELRHLPQAAFDTLARFYRLFADEGSLPAQFHQSRMVCLAKPGKCHNYTISAENTRPITIQTVFWRLWVSTFCKSVHLRGWLKDHLRKEIGGLSQEDIYETKI